MTLNGWLQILLFFVAVPLVTKPLGIFMAKVFARERTWLDPVLRPVEKMIYKLTCVNEEREMGWVEYIVAMLLFSAVSMLVLYLSMRVQRALPLQSLLNPQGIANVPPDLAFNTAASFTTNTNWQFYSGENAMSYLTQMAGLAYHNFISAAVGIALAIALIRGIARREKETLGNFWVDTTRAALWVLLPLCLIYSMFLVSQGVIQNLKPYDTVKLVEPQQVQKVDANGKPVVGSDGKPEMVTVTDQVIAQGPVASQEAIKMLGTNGGGFFGANSAHPFENPNALTNFIEIFSIFVIPAGLTYTLGRMTGSRRHGWAVFAAMSLLFFCGVVTAYWAEAKGNPLLQGADQHLSAMQTGGNMEGKEVRFGIANSALFATVTTDASCGAVNGQHDSFTPIGGLVPLANIMLGEIVFGGVGAGMYGMLVFVILSVFIAGLMVGRTPEYLGKKIEAYDVKMAMLYVLIFPFSILVLSAVSVLSPKYGLATLTNVGPHGLSEILYAFTSATGNNGSAFGGLGPNFYYNLTIGFAMLIGRFLMHVPMLAVAGNLARKKIVPPSPGTFPVTTPLFTVLLVSVIIIVGALTFFPAVSLGPVLEHLLMNAGKTF